MRSSQKTEEGKKNQMVGEKYPAVEEEPDVTTPLEV